MKIDLACMECIQSGLILTDKNRGQVEAELTDDGFCNATCPNGHKIVAVIQNPKYELLFDLGGLALIDGYTREAVSSFAVALERFYEFFVRLWFIDKKCEDDIYSEYWKKVANYTERQLGCFLTAYIAIYGKVPNVLSDNDTGFRNKVIHKGYIPTEKEVFEFGNKVGTIIQQISKEFIEHNKEAFMFEVFSRFKNLTDSKKPEGISISTMNVPTMLSTTNADFVHESEFSLEKKIESLKVYRTYVYSDFRKKNIDEYNYGILKGIYGNIL
jgi:hypothetical protein